MPARRRQSLAGYCYELSGGDSLEALRLAVVATQRNGGRMPLCPYARSEESEKRAQRRAREKAAA